MFLFLEERETFRSTNNAAKFISNKKKENFEKTIHIYMKNNIYVTNKARKSAVICDYYLTFIT